MCNYFLMHAIHLLSAYASCCPRERTGIGLVPNALTRWVNTEEVTCRITEIAFLTIYLHVFQCSRSFPLGNFLFGNMRNIPTDVINYRLTAFREIILQTMLQITFSIPFSIPSWNASSRANSMPLCTSAYSQMLFLYSSHFHPS